jgi:hypothetical protein
MCTKIITIFRVLSPDDAVCKHLWNVDQFLPDYTAQYPRRQLSYYFVSFFNITSYILLALR